MFGKFSKNGPLHFALYRRCVYNIYQNLLGSFYTNNRYDRNQLSCLPSRELEEYPVVATLHHFLANNIASVPERDVTDEPGYQEVYPF
jgi:hypothetical protein